MSYFSFLSSSAHKEPLLPSQNFSTYLYHNIMRRQKTSLLLYFWYLEPQHPLMSSLVFLTNVFLFVLSTKTSFIIFPSALQTWPNHSRRLLFIYYDIIFGLCRTPVGCSSWYFLLSHACNSALYLGPYMFFSTFILKVIRRLLSPLVSDQFFLAFVTVSRGQLWYNYTNYSVFKLRDSNFDLSSFIIL